MASKETNTSGEPGAPCAEYGFSEALLRTEIGFWREMIDSCRDTEPPDCIERMQQALALAEMRLGDVSGSLPSNVFPLDRARGAAR